jgi:30S ribosomal protein S31
MGRGDKKTTKGKIAMGSYGNTRKRKKASSIAKPSVKAEKEVSAEKPAKKAAAPKKTAAKAAPKKVTKKTEE